MGHSKGAYHALLRVVPRAVVGGGAGDEESESEEGFWGHPSVLCVLDFWWAESLARVVRSSLVVSLVYAKMNLLFFETSSVSCDVRWARVIF